MEGMVLHFDVSDKKGIIKDAHGVRYEFSEQDWRSKSLPTAGMKTDFMLADGAATHIYQMPSTITEASVTAPQTDSGSVWPDHSPNELHPTSTKLDGSHAGTETPKAKIGVLYARRKMNWTGMLAAPAVLATLYLPLLYSDYYGAVTPFLMTEDFLSLTYLLHLLIPMILFFIVICFYGGARKITIRAFATLAIAAIGYHYFNAFEQLAITWEGEIMAVTLIGGAYLNFAACGLFLLAAFSKHYSPLGAVSSGTAVVWGCIDTTGSHKELPGGLDYTHLNLSLESGEIATAKRVVVTDHVAPMVSPGVCGLFVFTSNLLWKTLRGIKTDTREVYEPPGNAAFMMFKSLLGAGVMALLTYGSVVSLLLIPIAPLFALASLLLTLNFFCAPFKVRHIRRTLENSGFSVVKTKKI